MYDNDKSMFAGPVEKMRKKPTTGGPMPKFEMPGNRVSPGADKKNKMLLKKQAIAKRFGK